ncbi:MAG: multifunctional CCA addition/repair protein [Flavobacterium sp.]|uniref:multifunctional CCA addition/repair protein n=1 Tax=Flavobacterium sp. TaxID=239 RepID=UPI00261C5543|nr:multifunctional CCA addition/repair protein [Flavobacterium sp.]MDD5150392.1 multifunctional CCA addition/repair protein [Flavobacterium sp.]
MNTYMVGGHVRDTLLGIESNDIDYIVTGISEAELLSLGYSKVGADFPVFLHPETREEYALPRIERSTGNRYTDFEVITERVSLEDDLLRRDITINAIAMCIETNTIFDPYNGKQDLEDGILRHVSVAFVEDPVRVLRIARFAAKFGFVIAEETKELISVMIEEGMLNALTSERIFKELEKVLKLDKPWIFFEVLDELGALEILFPELWKLKGQTQPEQWHPEGDAFIHTMLVLQEAVDFTDDIVVRFAALVHDLGKGLTKKEDLPKHHRHEQAGIPLVEQLCDRLKMPTEFKKVGMMTSREHLNIHNWNKLNPKTVVNIFERCDAFRNPLNFKRMLIASVCDANGRGPTIIKVPFSKVDEIMFVLQQVRLTDVSDLVEKKFTGEKMKMEVRRKRINTCKSLLTK